jgi:clan AA aspartic protease
VINGVVTGELEAVIRLRVQGPQGQDEEHEAVIDTGFTDFLTLPLSAVAALGLPFAAPAQATLADGSIVQLNFHRAKVRWDGALRDVFILASPGGALVGMSLLHGYELYVQVRAGGDVKIKRLD